MRKYFLHLLYPVLWLAGAIGWFPAMLLVAIGVYPGHHDDHSGDVGLCYHAIYAIVIGIVALALLAYGGWWGWNHLRIMVV